MRKLEDHEFPTVAGGGKLSDAVSGGMDTWRETDSAMQGWAEFKRILRN